MKQCCPKCFKPLQSTGNGPDWMSSEQWDASKAGDYFTEQCGGVDPNDCFGKTHKNGNVYFWEDNIAQQNDLIAQAKGWE